GGGGGEVGGGGGGARVGETDKGGSELFDRDVAVGVDADVGGDVHRLAHDRLGVERPVDHRARGGERVIAAGADAHHAGLGLEHVAGAGEHPRHLPVGDDQ